MQASKLGEQQQRQQQQREPQRPPGVKRLLVICSVLAYVLCLGEWWEV